MMPKGVKVAIDLTRRGGGGKEKEWRLPPETLARLVKYGMFGKKGEESSMVAWGELSFGLVLGISAGLSPGPLMSLVIAQTMQHGPREGVKVSLVPLLTDPPIILVGLLVMGKLASQDPLLGGISLVGAGLILFLARGVWLAKPPEGNHLRTVAPRSILKGLSVNLLSPNPWLFWVSIGVPTLLRAGTASGAIAFLVGFYPCLVGGKLGIALLIGRYRTAIRPSLYRTVMRLLALLLALFAVLLLRDGAGLLGLLP
jgi:threonine/homoserine/homoserine lactone efflux protein